LSARATLTLTPFWNTDDPVELVPSVDAIRFRRERGCRYLPAGEALWLLQAVDRMSAARIRGFAQAARLTTLPLCDMGEPELYKLVCDAVQAGHLVALRGGESGRTGDNRNPELRRLVRQIEERTRGRMSDAGRRLKLVVDVDLLKVPGRDNYEVVARDEAVRVLDGLARQWAGVGGLVDLLGRARAKLSPDWRPPFSRPDGLVLLRGVPVVQAQPASQETPITPSQLQKLKEPEKKDKWVKLHVIHADTGKAIEGAQLSLILPGEKDASSHKTDKEGLVEVTDLPAGTFSIEGVENDAAFELVGHEIT